MNRQFIYNACGLVVFIILISFIVLYVRANNDEVPSPSRIPNIIRLGPYAKNISLTENIGAYALIIKAEKLYVKKGKFFVFDTALQKQFVANKLYLSLYKDGIKKLEIYKDNLTMNPIMKKIEIEDPQILFPVTMAKPKSIRLETDKRLLTLYFKDRVDVWNLAN